MGRNSGKRRKEKKSRKAVEQRLQFLSPAITRLESARRRYVREWQITSTFFEQEGHYAWMASQVAGFLRILEIGCGNGLSTLALLKSGHKTVSIEENPRFMDETKRLLEMNSFTVSVAKRGSVIPARRADSYSIVYSQVAVSDADAVLIEGDILEDPKLVEWLIASPKFDAVVCWLMGTHSFRGGNACSALSGIANSTDNRLLTQNAVYERAASVLRPGGLLSVIDRTQYPDSDLLVSDFLAAHREQASVTDLVVGKLEARPYREPLAAGATKMVVRLPIASPGFDLARVALTSVTSAKPG
jgi:SAM-dependent methyltransferase